MTGDSFSGVWWKAVLSASLEVLSVAGFLLRLLSNGNYDMIVIYFSIQ
jgi:hypothetical protein